MPPRAKTGNTSIAHAVGRGAKSVGGVQGSAGKKSQSKVEPQGRRPSTPPQPSYTKEQLEEAKGREELDPSDPTFDKLWKNVQEKMGMPKQKPIHSEGMNRIDHILRVFDLDPEFGPCLGMTRLERWQRAKSLGDEPPEEVRKILETRQGVLDLKHSVLHDKSV